MNYYFYMLHLLQQNVVSLQVPMYIEATNMQDASSKAEKIKKLASNQFKLLFEPPDPVLFVQSINGPSFCSFFTNLGNGENVTLNLPANFNIKIFQFNHTNPLTALDALVIVPGSHAPFYSL